MMKDERAFSHDKPPLSASVDQHDGESDGHILPSPPTVPQDVPASAHPPKAERQLTPRRHVRLLLVAMVVMVLVVLAGGYGVFRAVSPSSRQPTSAFQQQTPCPFGLGGGLIDTQSVRCGWLSVPEDWSQPQGPTIRLAVAIFKTSSPPRPPPKQGSLSVSTSRATILCCGCDKHCTAQTSFLCCQQRSSKCVSMTTRCFPASMAISSTPHQASACSIQ